MVRFKVKVILHTYISRVYLENIFVVSCNLQRCAEADRDPQKISDLRKDCGYFVDEMLQALYRWNLSSL